MTKKTLQVSILFLLMIPFIIAQDNELEKLAKKYPTLVTTFSPILNKDNESYKIKWFRTDLLEMYSPNQLTCKENQLYIDNKAVEFLTPDLSKNDYTDYYKRVAKAPLVIFKWEVEIEKEGNYLVVKDGDFGNEGYLNNIPVLFLNNGVLSKKGSGKLWVSLVKGVNTIYLSTTSKSNGQISVISEAKFEQLQKELILKLKSETKVDLEWQVNQFLPYLASLKSGSHLNVISFLLALSKKNALPENATTLGVFLKIIQSCKIEYEAYMIEKFIYLNFPNIYFNVSATDNKWNGFIINNNVAKTKFLEQMIFDGQNKLTDLYFDKCIEVVSNQKDFKDKDKFIAKFYVDRFLYYFRIGRVTDSINLFAITKEKYAASPAELKYIDYTFNNYKDGLLLKEEDIIFVSSFDEIQAASIKDAIDAYDGKPEVLSKAFAIYSNLPHKLVKRNGIIVSLPYFFLLCKDENPKFKDDFAKMCREKIQVKIDKAKETRDLNLAQELIAKYDIIIPLPELRMMLLEEYFLRGSFLKALSQANFLFDNFSAYHVQLISKISYLENASEIIGNLRKVFDAKLKNSEIKIKGVATSIDKLFVPSLVQKNEKTSIGKFIKSIPLESAHIQYRNHDQIKDYQPIEPIFSDKNIVFNGGSYLANYSIKNNDVSWSYRTDFEYKKDTEPGPNQKRFITTHAGNQLFMFTNKDYSDEKTIKSFDLNGNLLWDVSERSEGLTEEPVCTPMEGQGKLFCLSYSNNETINTFNYSVIDSHSGKFLNITQLSLIPNKILDYNSYPFPRNWNTFTHDQHFTKDGAYIYGYSGTGVLFKADTSSGNLLWAKGVSKSSFYHNSQMDSEYGYAPSGYIKVFGDVLLSFMPDVQIFSGNNKMTSEHIWKSKYYRPKFIHARENNDCLYFSDFAVNDETSLFKIDPITGNVFWQIATNGIKITGEGDVLGNKLYLPADKSILIIDAVNGVILDVVSLKLQPLKIRCSENHSVILTAQSALIFQNDGVLNPELIKENERALNVSKIIEPDTLPVKELSFENINLELSIKAPETFFAGVGHWKRTKILKTSKPFHYLMIADEHVTLFREGFTQANGLAVPPAIIWYGQYPCFSIADDTIYISEYGKITALNLFTREKKWKYEYEVLTPAFYNKREKTNPVLAVCNKYIAFQTENQSIRVLDKISQKMVFELFTPAVKSICMDGEYLVALGYNSGARCFDISQNGKEIWTQTHNNRSDIYAENGNLVFVRYSDPSISFYDLATGKLKVQAKPVVSMQYTMNQWQLDSNYLYAYNMLYDANTGAPIPKFKECYKVTNGGYIALFAVSGAEGVYINDGKEYAFKTKCIRDHNNFNFSAIRKGNRLTLLTAWWIETFEIVEDKLVLIEAIKFNSGYIGDGQFPKDMQLMPLDNCLFEARNDELNFFRNFDTNLKYEPIQSFRVENIKKYDWPHSELYPEVEVDDKNWISYLGAKSQRKISYQAFGDEKFAYLKIKLSPQSKPELKHILYISGNGKYSNIALRWDPDYWDKCQISNNLIGLISSWKEIDLNGNIFLYMKFNLEKVFSRIYKNTQPDFNIELRQISNDQCDGLYRWGGAYHNGRKIFPWLNYTNEEADLLSDYELRSSMYENKVNFYPQGIDFIYWLKDRRRFYSVESNIMLLSKMLESNSKYYCSVNILSALFLEEVQLIRNKQPSLEEVSDEFTLEVNKIIKRISAQATQAGLLKEWIDYALSVITIEIFPFKTDYTTDWYSKAIYGLSVKSLKKEVMGMNYNEKNNPLTPMINKPYLEWIVPGMMTGFPKELNCDAIYLLGIGNEKTGIGRVHLFTPLGDQEICDRNGVCNNAEFKLKAVDGYNKEEEAKLIPRLYYSKGIKYNCVTVAQPTVRNMMIPIPMIKSPLILKNTGQTAETILTGLGKITRDNDNGPMMLYDYLALSGTLNDDEIKVAYGKFLYSLKNNTRACYHALRDIYQKNVNKKDVFDFMLDVMKSAKITTAAPRLFFLEYKNIFIDKKSFSFLGPVDKELVNMPEKDLTPGIAYKTDNASFQFGEGLNQKKGGTIYLASKITLLEKDRVYLIVKTQQYTKCIFSIWVNGKVAIENVEFVNFGNNYSQSISLNAGENTVLIKIVGSEELEWSKFVSLVVGDNYGAPIKGLDMKPIHK